MKILAIGDPHGNLEKLKKIPLKGVELILLTGDIGKADAARKQAFANIERRKQGLPKLEETPEVVQEIYSEIHNSTLAVLKYLAQFAPVYTIQGNVGIPTRGEIKRENERHGLHLPATREEISLLENVHLVKNNVRTVGDVRIGFLEYYTDVSWVREFKPADYAKRMRKAKKQTELARRVLQRISDLDILVCHQPPYGFLDAVNFPGAPKDWQGKHAGGKAILDYIRKHQPRYVFCGHIHEGEGHARIGKTEVYNLGVAGHRFITID